MAKYKIYDHIYGEYSFENPVINELISCAPMQRLKRINQGGLPANMLYKKGYSRFEHSLGVMLLLKYLGASEEEQIAGLLHDVSHRAFSHIYDWVINDYSKMQTNNEEAQDESHDDYIKNSIISRILSKYGYRADKISKLSNFGLLDRELPDLCADRIDYSLRQLDSTENATKLFKGLTVVGDRIVCKNKKIASEFAGEFLKLQTTVWASYESAAKYHLIATILRKALNLKIITMRDFWSDDDTVLDKLYKSKNAHLLKALDALKQKSISKPRNGVKVFKKFRYIDPLFIQSSGELLKLSDVDTNFRKKLEKQRMTNKKGILVPVIKL